MCILYDILSLTRWQHCSTLADTTFYMTYVQLPQGDNATAVVEFVLSACCCSFSIANTVQNSHRLTFKTTGSTTLQSRKSRISTNSFTLAYDTEYCSVSLQWFLFMFAAKKLGKSVKDETKWKPAGFSFSSSFVAVMCLNRINDIAFIIRIILMW